MVGDGTPLEAERVVKDLAGSIPALSAMSEQPYRPLYREVEPVKLEITLDKHEIVEAVKAHLSRFNKISREVSDKLIVTRVHCSYNDATVTVVFKDK